MRLYFIIIFISNIAFSQFKVTGSVEIIDDKKTDSLNVFLIDNVNRKTHTIKTDQNGKFEFYKIDKGLYNLIIDNQTHELYKKEYYINKDTILKVSLNKKIISLDEINISGQQKKIRKKVDRTVFTPSNNIAIKSGSANDVLKIMPGVLVQKEKITVIGKKDVLLFVDGKQLSIQPEEIYTYLNSINSANIKNIELISNPPSNFDSNGDVGIVNINLKTIKSLKNWSSNIGISQFQATYDERLYKANFNFKANKLFFSSNFSFREGLGKTFSDEEIYYQNSTTINKTKSINHSERFNGLLNLQYALNKKTTIDFQFSNNYRTPKDFSKGESMIETTYTNQPTQQQNFYNKNIDERRFNSLNFQLAKKIDTLGNLLVFKMDYFNHYKNNLQSLSLNKTNGGDIENGFENFGGQNINNFSSSSDVTMPTKFLNLEFGLKSSLTITKNHLKKIDYNNFLPRTSYEDDFNFSENINAIYLSGKRNMFKDWELKLGIRYEYTFTKGSSMSTNNENKKRYNNLFPSFFITKIKNDNSFSFSYSKRINRPKYNVLNPFKLYFNPYSYTSGNPNLKPSISHNFEFSYDYKENFQNKFYYTYNQNKYTLITYVDNSSMNQINIPKNFIDSHEFGVTENFSFLLFKKIESYSTLNLVYNKSLSQDESLIKHTQGFGGFIENNESFSVDKNKNYIVSVHFNYGFPSYGSLYKSKEVFVSDFSFRGIFLNKKIIVNLSVNDIFKTNINRWTQETNGITIYRTYKSDNPSFDFSINYNFGSSKINSKKISSSNKNEEIRAN